MAIRSARTVFGRFDWHIVREGPDEFFDDC